MMHDVLNITNGDCAVSVMQDANILGDYLPWRDVLHLGPVPETKTLHELSDIRAKYIADQGWASFADSKRNFHERDQVLQSLQRYEKVILWFEHDLYDQLQLVQLLDWFATQEFSDAHLYLICTDQYLGPMRVEEMQALVGTEKPVTKNQLNVAQSVWSAFRQTQPDRWQSLLDPTCTILQNAELPFLKATVERMLQEYPSVHNGLSRTAQQTLRLLAEKSMPAGKLFGCYQDTEESRFLGDSSFWEMLNQFLEIRPAVICLSEGNTLELPSKPQQVLSISKHGQALLNGDINWLDIYPYDFYLGGVHLTHTDPEQTWLCDRHYNLSRRGVASKS